MTHRTLQLLCESFGMVVAQVPSYGAYQRAFAATAGPVSVRWSTSYELGLLGLPRVYNGLKLDTHARTLREIRYLVGEAQKSNQPQSTAVNPAATTL